jgi:outer membrane lipoprotein-sorting protein
MKRRRLIVWTGIVAATLIALESPLARALTADEIVAASDRIRNPGRPYRATSTLVEYLSGKPRDQTVVTVLVKEDTDTGQFRNIVRYVDPARDRGKLVLGNGNIMWFYDPSSKASVRVSPQQRLIGQASIGDVITVNLSKNYKGTAMTEEVIQDADRREHKCWHLDLTATAEGATYLRVEYWVERDTYYPIKGKFYSDSGRLIKIAYYRKFEDQLDGVRPTEAIIIDAVDSARVTKLAFSDYRFQEIPDSWFQREYLARLKSE